MKLYKKSRVEMGEDDMCFGASIIGVDRRGKIGALDWILLSRLIWTWTNANSSNIS